MNYIDVDAGSASSAARATYATATTWDAWAGQTINTLHTVATDAQESVVTAAFQSYLADMTPKLHGMAELAKKQGVNLLGAVNTAIDADDTSTSSLDRPLTSANHLSTTVSRPINVE